MASELPSPKLNQAYVHASVLEAGHLNLVESFAVQGGSPTKCSVVPSMAFLLRHSQSGKILIFDLGLRKDWENYPPGVLDIIKKNNVNLNVPVDVVTSLRRGGLEPVQVDFVILSHIHFDHIGNPDLFPGSRFILGGDSEPLLAKGYSPKDAEPALEAQVAKELLPRNRTTFLSSDDWSPLGPFPRAHDFLGDGSVYIVNAPGHLSGHINLLVRTSAEGSWLCLVGDSAHDVRLLTGEKEIAFFPHPMSGNLACLHVDPELAKEHISRLRRLRENPKVLVLLAHDLAWYEENKDTSVFPGEIAST
ncbi:Metallo-hydrolase/oxidoreductase [Gautieria morchelliformis]|nr:Metallo-hydrolase/oxidoreductase [Gautieria morchelliformis]